MEEDWRGQWFPCRLGSFDQRGIWVHSGLNGSCCCLPGYLSSSSSCKKTNPSWHHPQPHPTPYILANIESKFILPLVHYGARVWSGPPSATSAAWAFQPFLQPDTASVTSAQNCPHHVGTTRLCLGFCPLPAPPASSPGSLLTL